MTVCRSLLAGWLVASLLPGFASAADDSPPPRVEMTPTPALTFDEALALALEQDPDLASAQLELGAAEARRQQAALRPNPDATFEVENLSG